MSLVESWIVKQPRVMLIPELAALLAETIQNQRDQEHQGMDRESVQNINHRCTHYLFLYGL